MLESMKCDDRFPSNLQPFLEIIFKSVTQEIQDTINIQEPGDAGENEPGQKREKRRYESAVDSLREEIRGRLRL